MKFPGLITILLLLFPLFLVCRLIFAYDAEIEIIGADEVWVESTGLVKNEIVNSSDLDIRVAVDAEFCHLDESWFSELKLPEDTVIDSTTSEIKIATEIAICHAHKTWESNLEKDNIDLPVNAKTPILFVPGLLGTEISDSDNNLIWLDIDRLINPRNLESRDDVFLDELSFDSNLKAVNSNLLLKDVIRFKKYFLYIDYTQGLINEFTAAGYVEGQNFFTFPYDWRYGVSGTYPVPEGVSQTPQTNSDLLGKEIARILLKTGASKVDVIAHSMGGLVVKKYVMENDDPKINKLVFVGVPNLGSPDAVQTLLSGNDFNIAGLNPVEMQKISRNMPAAYDLLPGKPYYDLCGSYLGFLGQSGTTSTLGYNFLNYADIQLYLKSKLNQKGLSNSAVLHSADFDNYDTRIKVPGTYNIVGCKSGTVPYAAANGLGLPTASLAYSKISGDDTVPFESADSIPVDNNKVFYAPLVAHSQMPSANGVRQMITSIIASGNPPANIISYPSLKSDPSLCEINGDIIEIHSPIDIFVTQIDGGKNLRLGLDVNGNIIQEIPGASFDVINDHKYLYLPQGEGEQYTINLTGSGNGTYTLIDKKVNGENVTASTVYADVPVVLGAAGSLDISASNPVLQFDSDNNGAKELIPVTAELNGNQVDDILPPQTIVTVNGTSIKEYYNQDVSINLSATDYAQEGITPAGMLSIGYSLDNGATIIAKGSTVTIAVQGEGSHALTFFAIDKLGNKEERKTISLTIDKTAPEFRISFDPIKKDLKFTGADNYGSVAVSDQDNKITLTDLAGNVSRIDLKEKNRQIILRAQIAGLSYNGKAVDISKNNLNFTWLYDKKGNLTMLLQQMKADSGAYIIATYNGKTTTVVELKNMKVATKKFSGLKLVNFTTDKGKFAWAY